MKQVLPFFHVRWFATLSYVGIIFFFSLRAIPLSAKQPDLSADGTFALISLSAEKLPRDLLRNLSEQERSFQSLSGYPPGDWPPIVVVLHPESDDAAAFPSLVVSKTDDERPKIQVDLAVNKAKGRASRQFLANAMLLRAFYAEHSPEQGSPVATFPSWLTHALGSLCSSSSSPVSNPAGYLQGGNPPTIDSFLAQSPPKGENESLLELYDGTASALLKAGLEHGAASGIQRWIGHYDPLVPSRAIGDWPTGWNKTAIERIWLLLMANGSGAEASNVTLYGIPETLAKYDAIISLVPTPGHSFALLKKQKEYDYTARQISGRLSSLALRANPLAAPLLEDTIDLCQSLKKLRGRKLDDKEWRIRFLREYLLKRSRSIGTYLDWYEAAKVSERSKLFDSILAVPETPVRHGPVGSYLDAVEARGW